MLETVLSHFNHSLTAQGSDLSFFTQERGFIYKNNDTFEFVRHVSVVQRPSSVESRINLKFKLILLSTEDGRCTTETCLANSNVSLFL